MGTTSKASLLRRSNALHVSASCSRRSFGAESLISTLLVGTLLLLLPAERVLRAQAAPGEDDPANLRCERERPADTEPLDVDRGSKGLAGMLRKLGTRASLLMIVAHPDDEDGGMLTYVSRGLGARTGMMTLTRGEGGQNVMSGDFNDALGLVRTRELLSADRYLGVDQMFGTEVDFGFSKTKEEAFSQWTHQRVLYDAVRAVRLYRPLVLTSVFLGGPTDGHGQHQVSGEMAQEVFTAAADPKLFPEMGLPVWAPRKVYARVPFAQVDARGMYDYATGKYVPARFFNYVTQKWSTDAPKATVTVPEGDPSPLLGMSYVQFARQGLALQRSQIGSGVRLASSGRFDVGYTRYGSRAGMKPREATFFDDVDVTLPGIVSLAPSLRAADAANLRENLARLQKQVETLQAGISSGERPASAAFGLRTVLQGFEALVTRVSALPGLPARERFDLLHELKVKRVQANDALAAALGLELRAEVVARSTWGSGDAPRRGSGPAPDVAVAGDRLTVEVALRNDGAEPVQVRDEGSATTSRGVTQTRLEPPAGAATVKPESTYREQVEAVIQQNAPLSRPFFNRKGLEQPFYDLLDPSLRNAPVSPPALTVWRSVDWKGVTVHLGAIATTIPHTAPDKNNVPQPLRITPPVSLALVPSVAILPKGTREITLQVTSGFEASGSVKGELHLDLPRGWTAAPFTSSFQSPADSRNKQVPVTITPVGLGTRELPVSASADYNGKSYREGYRPVGYPGIIHDDLYEPATTRVRGVDLEVPAGLKVAYLPGTGDAVEETFAGMGVAAHTVSVADIGAGRLAGYDALVLGVRAYAAHQELRETTAKILEFARDGGTVIVQYNTAEYSGSDAPYPLSLGSAEKVIEETATVRLLQPDSQILSWPNRLTEHDFDGWLEERGHGFMGEWDPRYAAVTEVHDTGQDPQRGGLLVAPVGKGAYVYCAYALYRQLPEGVPGAFRLLANMVSLGRRP